MLTIPQLDDSSFDQIFNRAKSMIPMLTDEWTDFNYHDPGITMLQTFSWLSDMQNFYINSTGDLHRLKYLKLMGIYPSKPTAAECLIGINSNNKKIYLPKGTKVCSGNVVYEMTESYRNTSNRIVKIINEANGKGIDITHFAGIDDSYVSVFSADKSNQSKLYFGFKKEIVGDFSFYIDIDNSIKRNDFADDFSLSKLDWEYFDGNVWQKADLLEDRTCGLLKSGYIKLHSSSKTSALSYFSNDILCHYIRCILIENEYDILPKIGLITVNCTEIVQTNTICKNIEFTYNCENEIAIDYYINDTDLISVTVECDDVFESWFHLSPNDNDLCSVVDGEFGWQKKIVFNEDKYGKIPKKSSRIRVIIISAEIFPEISLGEMTGCSSETIEINIDNVYEIELALINLNNGRINIDFWTCCEDINTAKFDEKCFQFDFINKKIIFGDAINGVQPEQGMELIIVGLKTSFLSDGNILKGEINSFLTDEFQGIEISNLFSATNGQNAQTSKDIEHLIINKIENVSKAVSQDDYKQLVMQTAGLMIDKVNVITGRSYAEAYDIDYRKNSVYIAVKPKSESQRPVLSERYKKIIAENLERHRLLTTEIIVTSAKYVGIEISGSIVLKDTACDYVQIVTKKLFEYIDFSNKKGKFIWEKYYL